MWKITLFLTLSVCLMFTINMESVDALASRRYEKDNNFLPFFMLMMRMNNNNDNQKQKPQVIYAKASFGGFGKGIIGGYGYGEY